MSAIATVSRPAPAPVEVLRGVSLAGRTSFKTGGTAREFHAPATIEGLDAALSSCARRGVRPFILGGGANTLFPDGEFTRPVISTEKLRWLEVDGTSLLAECGVRLNYLIQAACRAGLGGLEGFVGIPGTAGGAVMMNAGGGGWSFGDRVEELGLLPLAGGELVRRPGCEVAWRYRGCDLEDFVVAWVRLRLEAADPGELRARARELMLRKARTQPLGEASAGCIFKNPPGEAAARLIDGLGLKGLACGGAKVSERHANFIVNARGEATAADVMDLVEEVRGRVLAAYGIRLETEIVLPGAAVPPVAAARGGS